MAERSQLINSLGRWVIDEAMAQLVRWRDAGVKQRPIAVNVSFVQIVSGSLLRDLRECSARHGVDLRFLELELTETVVMENTQQTVDTLNELALLGVRVSLDDFGTGYSSLAYVQQLPLDALKIDRSFISQLENGGPSQVLTSGIIGLAHGLQLATVAEGVETREQWLWLRNNGCSTAQGYLFSRPVPASDIPAAIRAIESLDPGKA
jgi:EAL domain-containing protein (putative c-di-GMP-specific phosphodiesterase class I)